MKDRLAGVLISFLSKQFTLVTFTPAIQGLSYPPPSCRLAHHPLPPNEGPRTGS